MCFRGTPGFTTFQRFSGRIRGVFGSFRGVPERYCKFTGVLGAYQGVSSDLRGVLCGFRRVVPYHGASEVSRYVYGGLRIR